MKATNIKVTVECEVDGEKVEVSMEFPIGAVEFTQRVEHQKIFDMEKGVDYIPVSKSISVHAEGPSDELCVSDS